MEIPQIGKWLIFIGLGMAFLGMLCILGGKLGIHWGKLPGDIAVHKDKFSVHIPIATSIIVSIILTVLLNLMVWLLRK